MIRVKRMAKIWVQTFTGKRINPFAPRSGDICIEDIAHALSLICRFNGHTETFYSVAEHCIWVSKLVSRKNALAGLLHDAAEAYFADVSSPVKDVLPGIQAMEDNLLRVIMRKFKVFYNRDDIKRADWIMCATEARDLIGDTTGWYLPMPPMAMKIQPVSPATAERIYLERFKELICRR